jgi:SAM-dependent methyltransferase
VEIHGEHGEHRGLARDAHGATIRAIRAIRGPLFLIHGDITALPLANESFDATLAVHVLHLVADWRGALSEALRVTQTGGLFILGRDWRDPNSAGVKLRGKLREAVMELLPGIKPPAAGAAIPQALAKLGAEPQGETTAATWESEESPAHVLEEMASRSDAETWVLDDETLSRAVGQVRDWAEHEYSDLSTSQVIERRFVLSVSRKER